MSREEKADRHAGRTNEEGEMPFTGVRIGEAKHPGPYSYGGAASSGAGGHGGRKGGATGASGGKTTEHMACTGGGASATKSTISEEPWEQEEHDRVQKSQGDQKKRRIETPSWQKRANTTDGKRSSADEGKEKNHGQGQAGPGQARGASAERREALARTAFDHADAEDPLEVLEMEWEGDWRGGEEAWMGML